jgi:hypothetical protein
MAVFLQLGRRILIALPVFPDTDFFLKPSSRQKPNQVKARFGNKDFLL